MVRTAVNKTDEASAPMGQLGGTEDTWSAKNQEAVASCRASQCTCYLSSLWCWALSLCSPNLAGGVEG
jgi:hypothetical protein